MAYTTIDDPTKYFDTTLWTGDGGARTITGLNHKPDLIWTKTRSVGYNHMISDSSRGFNANSELGSNSTAAEGGLSADVYGYKSGHTADGWTMVDGTDTVDGQEDGNTNQPSVTYVGWTWAANGGTTTTNDASSTGVGNTDSVYQANTTAGFSIVTWTGPSGSDARTMAHGLGGTPELIIYKNRDEVFNWYVGTSAITFNFNTDYLQLNTNIAKATDAGGTVFNSAPTSTVIGGANSSASAKENIKYVAYCFRSIQGYSKIGSYTGNGNATDGPFIYTGFKPAWIMQKRTDSADSWYMWDVKRALDSQGYVNRNDKYLQANSSGVQSTGAGFDFLSNGFRPVGTNAGYINASGGTYIYMAFAESPLVGSDGTPTTAR